MALHSVAWHSMEYHSMVQHSTARHGTAWHGMARHNTAWHCTLLHPAASSRTLQPISPRPLPSHTPIPAPPFRCLCSGSIPSLQCQVFQSQCWAPRRQSPHICSGREIRRGLAAISSPHMGHGTSQPPPHPPYGVKSGDFVTFGELGAESPAEQTEGRAGAGTAPGAVGTRRHVGAVARGCASGSTVTRTAGPAGSERTGGPASRTRPLSPRR